MSCDIRLRAWAEICRCWRHLLLNWSGKRPDALCVRWRAADPWLDRGSAYWTSPSQNFDVAIGGVGEGQRRHDWLLDRAATYLRVHARLVEARPLAEWALAIDEAALGTDHPTVATDLNTWPSSCRTWGRLARTGHWPNGPWPSLRTCREPLDAN